MVECQYKEKCSVSCSGIILNKNFSNTPPCFQAKKPIVPLVEVGCPNCHVLCVLEEKNKQPNGYYKETCWSCSQPLPFIRVTIN